MSLLFKRRAVISLFLQTFMRQPPTPSKCLTTIIQRFPKCSTTTVNSYYKIDIRTKSKASKKKSQESDESESDDENQSADFDSLLQDKHTKVMTIKVTSLRADGILKNALGLPRNKIEEMFYESKIRINGKKMMKKSDAVQDGDELDIIKGVNVKNPNFLQVARVEVLEVGLKKESYHVRVRRSKNLTIDNYEDAWKGDTT